jgi:hypothetical protein
VLKSAIYLIPALLMAQSAPPVDGIAYFERNIRPLLIDNCYGCHSSKLPQPMGGLLLDSRAGMLRGGKSGVPAIVPGKPEESILLGAVLGSNKDLRMPPGKDFGADRHRASGRVDQDGRTRSAGGSGGARSALRQLRLG